MKLTDFIARYVDPENRNVIDAVIWANRIALVVLFCCLVLLLVRI
ncbi:hypothetical protein SAMN04488128_10727 [Chitinophaga eiseniae]|uniref:Uncharacterized protein n=1 Tax=Chitinophaga eiseniae TaxID=634771 RepID=A0A1T4TYZ3_9BACT|nr:hypothetical protein [Chitinophaga eiseniae]SKA45521.1 hypothetical protein SAMN04488128_10727 [Chitinophaga eiseniae]